MFSSCKRDPISGMQIALKFLFLPPLLVHDPPKNKEREKRKIYDFRKEFMMQQLFVVCVLQNVSLWYAPSYLGMPGKCELY